MADNPFDFSDLSDLPEDLQKKLHTDTNDHAKEYADVLKAGADAGVAELDINQIIAAGIRMGMEVPTQQTVRGYLNAAIKMGLIHKPSRQTYAYGGEVAEEAPKKATKAKAEEVKSDDAVATSEDADPLADLGL